MTLGNNRTLSLFGDDDEPRDEGASERRNAGSMSRASPASGEEAEGAWAAAALLAQLRQWSEEGWIRRLDVALPAMVLEWDPGASPWLLLSTTVLCHLEGRGHTCLSLVDWVGAAPDLLAWPAEAARAWSEAWRRMPDRALSGAMPGGKTAIERRLTACLDALRSSACVDVGAAAAHAGVAPLVLDGPPSAPRLYLRRYWMHEQRVARALAERSPAQRSAQPGTSTHAALGEATTQDAAVVRGWLDALFPSSQTSGAAPQISAEDEAKVNWQKLACAMAVRGRLGVITGGPGTGKTYTAARLLALLLALAPHGAPLRVALAAPTGKAAARLKQSIDNALLALPEALIEQLNLKALTEKIGAARTLHSLLGARPDTRVLQHDAHHPLDVDVLIVDEASMVHLEMMSALMEALPARARLILLGDKDQLASVEAGAVLGDLCRDAAAGRYDEASQAWARDAAGVALPAPFCDAQGSALAQHTVMLRESHRFGGQIGELALAVNAGKVSRWQTLRGQLSSSGEVVCLDDASPEHVLRLAVEGRSGAEGGYGGYLSLLKEPPLSAAGESDWHAWATELLRAFDRFRILCAVRQGPWGVETLNREIQKRLTQVGLLRGAGSGEWFAGRPVMVTRNDAALGIFNGDIGVALPSGDAAGGLKVWFMQGDRPRPVSLGRLAHVETAFAMTVHKSQGSEFAHAALVLPDGMAQGLTRELVYTGITRAKSAFTLVAPRADLLDTAINTPTRRGSGLLQVMEEMRV